MEELIDDASILIILDEELDELFKWIEENKMEYEN